MRAARILVGDVRERLKELPDHSVQCVVTSPPYWGLRDYGHEGQIGLERSPTDYINALCDVFREVWRVLKDDGTVWLNLGDSYATQGGRGEARMVELGRPSIGAKTPAAARGIDATGVKIAEGLKPKDLVGIPWRVALALQAAGWYLRQDIIWSKPNPMPESVTDRCTKAHEYIFLLTKRERYYFDAEAIAEEASGRSTGNKSLKGAGEPGFEIRGGFLKVADVEWHARNKRSVWHVATQPYPEAHFATYPEALIEPCILAGSREDETVFDPFCGSGTTGVVACRHNRNFIGIELNQKYAGLAEKRILGDASLLNTVKVCLGDDAA